MRLVRVRRSTALLSVSALALALWACETARNIGGIQRDVTPPSILLSNTAGDTQDIAGGLRFNISAVDNLALKSVDLTFSGGLIGTLDTTFVGQVKTYAVGRNLVFGTNSGAGGNITIVGRATDGAGNFAEDTLNIFLKNVQALIVTLISPSPGAIASQNRSIPIQVHAQQNSGVTKIGFLVSPRSAVSNPTTPPNDSIVFLGTLPDTANYTDTLTVLAATGTFDVVGFAEDSAGRRGFSNIVTVTIQSAANDVTPPQVGAGERLVAGGRTFTVFERPGHSPTDTIFLDEEGAQAAGRDLPRAARRVRVEGRGRGRPAARVEHVLAPGRRVVDQPERVAADARHVRVDDAERGVRRHHRVDRGPAAREHLEPGDRGALVRGRERGAAREERAGVVRLGRGRAHGLTRRARAARRTRRVRP